MKNLNTNHMNFILTNAPIYVNWNYTHICNFSCCHCYSREFVNDKEMSPSEALLACQKIIEAGVLQVNLGGGEPLLRKDCINTIQILSKHGVRVVLSSNGWFLNREKLIKLRRAGLAAIFLSLDHSRPEKHDEFRNMPGSFSRVIQALRDGSDLGIEMFISTVVTSLNFDSLDELIEIASHNGAIGINLKRFRPVGNLIRSQKKLLLNEEQLSFVMDSIKSFKEKATIDIYFLYHDYPISNIDEGCPCGRKSLAIKPNGDISPCVYSDIVIGNILSDDLQNIWRNSPVLQEMRSSFSCVACK